MSCSVSGVMIGGSVSGVPIVVYMGVASSGIWGGS